MTDATAELEALEQELTAAGPLATFPWHAQQIWGLSLATNTVVVAGGNQSGKTTLGLGIVSQLVRRGGPIYKRLLKPVGRRLKIWVSPNLHEKWRSNWEQRVIHEVLAGIPHHYVETPQPHFTWEDSLGGGELYGKSMEQGFMAFESDMVDLCLFDEEPLDKRLYTSAQARLSGTNGVIVLLFTPLNGITWTYGALYLPTVQPEYQVAPRVWYRPPEIAVVQCGMADNPQSVAGGGVARLQNDPSLSESERQTRLYGRYGFTEGLLLPMFADLLVSNAASPYIIPALPPDRPYSWYLTLDPAKRHAGLLTAIDHEGNRYYCAEHYAEGLADRLHADAYRKMLLEWAPRIAPQWPQPTQDVAAIQHLVDCWADPGGSGAQSILNLADCGLYAKPVPKDAGSVKASIELLRRAAYLDPLHRNPWNGRSPAPHVYFLSTLQSRWTWEGMQFCESRLMFELRQYRQKPNGKPDEPVKELDDVVDCCVVGDTLVDTWDGPQRIADLVGRSGYVWTPRGWRRYSDVRVTRVVPVVELRTVDGRAVCATVDHRIQLASGEWRPVGQCRPGDRLLDISHTDAATLGDGSDRGGRSHAGVPGQTVLPQSEGLLSPDRRVVASRGVDSCSRPDSPEASRPSSERRPRRQSAGESGTRARAATLAESYDTGPARGLRCATQSEPGGVRVGGGVASVPGRQGMASAPWARLAPEAAMAAPALRPVRSLVSDAADVGAVLPQQLQVGLAAGAADRSCGASVCVVREGVSGESLHADADVFPLVRGKTVAVSSLETAGVAPVYNMEVEDAHCFSVGGLVLHNCRYVELVRPFTPAPADLTLAHARAQLDSLSRRAAEEYDELVKPKKPRVFAPL